MQAGNSAPIGVIDSGVGGLSVLKCLRERLPREKFLYLGDTARTPYGSRSEAEIRAFVEEMLLWLERQNVKLAVIACNTLTMLGMESLQREHLFPLVGMSKGAKLLLAEGRRKKVAVFATVFTVGTGAHEQAVLAEDPAAKFLAVACPKYVPLIEGERFASPEMRAAVAEYAEQIKAFGAEALLLGCTHYPFIRAEIEAALEGVAVIDPAEETADKAAAVLAVKDLATDACAGSVTVCCTADVERVKRLTSAMMPGIACDFREISLQR